MQQPEIICPFRESMSCVILICPSYLLFTFKSLLPILLDPCPIQVWLLSDCFKFFFFLTWKSVSSFINSIFQFSSHLSILLKNSQTWKLVIESVPLLLKASFLFTMPKRKNTEESEGSRSRQVVLSTHENISIQDWDRYGDFATTHFGNPKTASFFPPTTSKSIILSWPAIAFILKIILKYKWNL